MLDRLFRSSRRALLPLCFAAFIGAGMAGCVSSADRQRANYQEDANTCASFGSEYGSRAYSECMLEQQRRRDAKQLESLERTRMTTEIAKDAQIMAERARRQRCDRDPDRRECEKKNKDR